MERPTIRDIATVAGVSPSAVSFALNGRSGVSQTTRRRILAVANEMGWTPNAAARALSASRAGAIGLVIARPSQSVAAERFFFEFILGMQAALTSAGVALLLQIVTDPAQEIATYRTWWSQHRVDGVVVVDPRREDPRLASLAELGLPYVLVGERDEAGMPSVIGDEEGMIEIVITHLLEQGRRRIAYMSGMSTLLHTERRSAAMASLGRSRGVEIVVSTAPDYTERSGAQATTELIAGPRSPDAIVYDNEVLAVGGLTALRQEGRHPGADIALVSLEDSPLCRALSPSLTSVHREPAIMGDTATRLLLEHLSQEGSRPREDSRAVQCAAPSLIIRDSSPASDSPAPEGGTRAVR
ncbi:LacI family transcriptional regulator [Actinomyces bowdenii]|uniref:LacI family DNA-binding transcriptional regulator n=1 Tax=Actinomyces bowdenii TaxID=131109 RepID=UPI00214C88FD|nr:LacI family DNA-binding transcriptional regulator [Actinomyces bowdenii]MCR2051500.1 LacI family transcriptional regulator [Actinomyces bowdenii]